MGATCRAFRARIASQRVLRFRGFGTQTEVCLSFI
jgi:hypothetical protein